MEGSLKIISLNCWGGRALYPLMRFLQRQQRDTDVFCLQEVHAAAQSIVDQRHPDEFIYGPLFQLIARELDGTHVGFHATRPHDVNHMSQAMFVRRELTERSTFRVNTQRIFDPLQPFETGSRVFSGRLAQYAVIPLYRGTELPGDHIPSEDYDRVMVINYHGLWTPDGKEDSAERRDQSNRLVTLMRSHGGPTVLCGDLNLDPGTKSLEMLTTGTRMRNLVTANPLIRSTRTPLFRLHHDYRASKYADYIFISDDIQARPFEVMPDIASDHAPLMVDAWFAGRNR